MTSLVVKAMLAGLFFGVWPLLMNRSGLAGYPSAAAFSLAALIFVLPFALNQTGLVIPPANWYYVIAAGIIGAIGLLFFNSMLADATPQSVSTLFVCMILVQIVVPSVYNVVISGSISVERIAGYTLAATSAYLLIK